MTLGFVLGGVALVVCSYVMAMRRPASGIDGTTEAAALTVLALATLAGTGWVMLAAGAGSLMVLALSEKQRLHGLVRHIGDAELHAALQFSVLALVILPLLPAGPLLGDLGIRPRALWIVVLLFSALNFAGYLARRAVGPQRGYGIAGGARRCRFVYGGHAQLRAAESSGGRIGDSAGARSDRGVYSARSTSAHRERSAESRGRDGARAAPSSSVSDWTCVRALRLAT